MNRRPKICMNAMVANESRVILRMLESCYRYIDYWVVQDNGSTDGTQDLIRNFFSEKGIPGSLYEIEWQYPGWNRDHTLQECLKTDHGCDWILRMDADEQLVVDEDFDWKILEDNSVQSFNVTAHSGGSIYYRTWLWNSRLPWYFKHDKRHEVILLPGAGELDNNFQILNLPKSFRHVLTNDGQTWADPLKFLKDALELEADQICSGKVLTDDYHLFYIGKSYNDCYSSTESFPFKKIHGDEYARRCIFYMERYVERIHPGFLEGKDPSFQYEMTYLAVCLIGNAYKYIGDFTTSVNFLQRANTFCPARNEHHVFLAEVYEMTGEYEKMHTTMDFLMGPERKNPFPRWYFLIHNECYWDTGTYVNLMYQKSKDYMGEKDPDRQELNSGGMWE